MNGADNSTAAVMNGQSASRSAAVLNGHGQTNGAGFVAMNGHGLSSSAAAISDHGCARMNSDSARCQLLKLREAIQAEWASFRQCLEHAASQQFRRQEELFAGCLEGLEVPTPKRESSSNTGTRKVPVLAPSWTRPSARGALESPEHSPRQLPAFVGFNAKEQRLRDLSGRHACKEPALDSVFRLDAPPSDNGASFDEEKDRLRVTFPDIGTGPTTANASSTSRRVLTRSNTESSFRLPRSNTPLSGVFYQEYPSERTEVTHAVDTALEPLKQAVQRIEETLFQRVPGPCSSPRLPPHRVHSSQSLGHSVGSKGDDEPDATAAANATGIEPEQEPRESTWAGTFQEMAAAHMAWNKERSFWKGQMEKRCSGLFDWWDGVEEPPRTGRLASVVQGKPFETLCASVIIVNAGFTCYTTNREIHYLDPTPPTAIIAVELCFLAFYTVELIVKLCVHRCYFFCNSEAQWNWFDALLVVFSLADQIVTLSVSQDGGTDLTFMRTLRVMKMAKVLRGLRVMKFFVELRLMLNSLAGSLSSLFWSIVMLMLIFYIFGLVFVQGLSNSLIELDYTPEELRGTQIMNRFGSVQAAVLSLYEAATGGVDWNEYLELIFDNTGYMYSGLFVFFIAFSQIALLNILTAIFVQNAMKLAQPDRETQALEQRSKELAEFDELRRLMHVLDTKKKGTVNMQEFSKHIKSGKLGAQLQVLGLSIRDAQHFWSLAAERKDEELSIDGFIDTCMRLRGHATCIEMHSLAKQVRQVQRSQSNFQKDCNSTLSMLSESVQEVLFVANSSLNAHLMGSEADLLKLGDGVELALKL